MTIKMIDMQEAMNLHWYAQVKTRESGPYSYLEILSMVYNKDLSETDFLTYRGLGAWHAVKDFANFEPETLEQTLYDNNIDPEDSSDVPFRRSIRIPTSSETLVVVDDYFFKCVCIDLSTGGCLIKLPRGKIKADQIVKLHFYEDHAINLHSFNMRGEAIRVISAEKLKEGSNYYDLVGIKFQQLKKEERDTLRGKIREVVFNTLSEEDIKKVLNRGKALAA